MHIKEWSETTSDVPLDTRNNIKTDLESAEYQHKYCIQIA